MGLDDLTDQGEADPVMADPSGASVAVGEAGEQALGVTCPRAAWAKVGRI